MKENFLRTFIYFKYALFPFYIIVKAVAARKEYLFMQELTCFQRQPYP
ncbi:hypothetical protein HMPREF3218_0200362 [Prevotella bivia]|nr:hypothetical protein HMPREF3218_0200362 [Prevotella bivia]